MFFIYLGGLGYLEIKKPEDYDNLPEHLREFPKKFVVTSSVTHQLHCLYAIAEAYSALSSNSSRVPEETPWHLTHCFDYLRQSVMCCGDVALEGQQTTFPKGFDGSDGWDAKHVCKDYSQVYDYLESNRADNKLWIWYVFSCISLVHILLQQCQFNPEDTIGIDY